MKSTSPQFKNYQPKSGKGGLFQETFPIEKIQSALKLVNEGMLWRDAAKSIGMSHCGFRRRVRQLGLDFRNGHKSIRTEITIALPKSVTDLAYLAGILDGEGYITIAEKPRKAVRVGITNTHRGLIDWLLTIGGSAYENGRSKLSKKPCYQWQLYSRSNVEAFLAALEPFMRIKRDKANKALTVLRRFKAEDTEWMNNQMRN